MISQIFRLSASVPDDLPWGGTGSDALLDKRGDLGDKLIFGRGREEMKWGFGGVDGTVVGVLTEWLIRL